MEQQNQSQDGSLINTHKDYVSGYIYTFVLKVRWSIYIWAYIIINSQGYLKLFFDSASQVFEINKMRNMDFENIYTASTRGINGIFMILDTYSMTLIYEVTPF